jgi:ABC-2 type transport system ATP-binding protein
MTDMAVIETKNLSKTYPGGTVGLEDLSITVEEGEVFGFLGPNGAGKTTTVRLLNGTLTPTGGKALVLGGETGGEEVRGRTATLAERARMYDHLTARENLRFFASLYDIPSETAVSRIEELLERMDLSSAGDAKLGTYSTGMRKRLHLIRTLINDPDILFLDEPTSGLDPESARDVNRLIRSLAKERGTTVFLCTHNLFLAEEICDAFGFIKEGALIVSGTKESLIESALEDRNVEITTDSGLERYSISSREDISRKVEELVREGRRIYEVREPRPSLEEVYFRYLGKGEAA